MHFLFIHSYTKYETQLIFWCLMCKYLKKSIKESFIVKDFVWQINSIFIEIIQSIIFDGVSYSKRAKVFCVFLFFLFHLQGLDYFKKGSCFVVNSDEILNHYLVVWSKIDILLYKLNTELFISRTAWVLNSFSIIHKFLIVIWILWKETFFCLVLFFSFPLSHQK